MTALLTCLRNTLAASPGLTFISDGDYPLQAVSLSRDDLTGWQETFAGDGLLGNQYSMNPDYLPILKCFAGRTLRSFERANGKPSQVEVLIVAKECCKWVGLKSVAVRT